MLPAAELNDAAATPSADDDDDDDDDDALLVRARFESPRSCSPSASSSARRFTAAVDVVDVVGFVVDDETGFAAITGDIVATAAAAAAAAAAGVKVEAMETGAAVVVDVVVVVVVVDVVGSFDAATTSASRCGCANDARCAALRL